jgi:hypothetical protein
MAYQGDSEEPQDYDYDSNSYWVNVLPVGSFYVWASVTSFSGSDYYSSGPFIYHDFGFNIPSDAIISGVSFTMYRYMYMSDGSSPDSSNRIRDDGTYLIEDFNWSGSDLYIDAISDDESSSAIWPKTTDAEDYTFGGEYDNWGCSSSDLKPSVVNGNKFGVVLFIKGRKDNTSKSLRAAFPKPNSGHATYRCVMSVYYDTPDAPYIETYSPSLPDCSSFLGAGYTESPVAPITDRGICWNTFGNPTTSDEKLPLGTGNGYFEGRCYPSSGGNTTYYVRAYATNSVGTSYGSQFAIYVWGTPALNTAAVTSITNTTAVSGGNSIQRRGTDVLVKGVVWNTSGSPTLTNKLGYTEDGSGSGDFISNLSGLSASTTYYVRAYATNACGTGYGTQVSFTTSGAVVSRIYARNSTSWFQVYAQRRTSSGTWVNAEVKRWNGSAWE